jgi:hypothetical protein
MVSRSTVSVAVGALLLAGCGSSDDRSRGTASETAPTSSSTTSESPSTASTHPAVCLNPEGGRCVNELTPGQEYTTTLFEPAITYSVTEEGWANYEDLPGNFLLVPPGNDLDGVNAGTSDFLGVYSSIVPSRFTDLEGCKTAPVKHVSRTPRDFVAWLEGQQVLAVSRPRPVALGGLDGLEVDVRVAEGGTPPTCALGPDRITVALLFSGVSPSSLDHGVIAGMTMRLDLFALGKQLMVVELDDIDAAAGDLDFLSAEAARMKFAT